MLGKTVFVGSSYGRDKGMAMIRIILGLLLIYHGQEVFNKSLMHEYATWDNLKGPNGLLMVYFGKSSELIAGISLLLGIGTRLGAILMITTFLYITFFVGNGRFWYEDQHPFMFVLFGLVYLLNGPGIWSLDRWFFNQKGHTSE